MNPDGSAQQQLTQGGGVRLFAWSPDGSLAALAITEAGSTKVRVVHPDGSVVFERANATDYLWSPRQDRLALIEGPDIEVADSAGSQLRLLSFGRRPEWSPDGKALAYIKMSGSKGVPSIMNVDNGQESPLSADLAPDDPIYPIAWHPAGAVIAFHNGAYDLTNGTRQDLPGTAIYWSPDGRLLLVALAYDAASQASPAQLLDATQGLKPVIGFEIRPSVDNTPAWLFIQRWTDWNSTGRYLVYLDPEASGQRVRFYDTVNVKQAIYKNIKGERPDISPDSQYAVFMDSGKVWYLTLDGKILVPVADGGFPLWQPGPAPAGSPAAPAGSP